MHQTARKNIFFGQGKLDSVKDKLFGSDIYFVFENSEYNVEIKTHCAHEDGVWQSNSALPHLHVCMWAYDRFP